MPNTRLKNNEVSYDFSFEQKYLFSWFKDKLFIACMKDTTGLDMYGVHKYITNYKDKRITVEEF